MHNILHDRSFDIDKFIEEDVRDFWISALDYLEICGQGKEEGFFRKIKYINSDEVLGAIAIVVQKSKLQTYDRALLQKVSKVFQILLHPMSPNKIRKQSMNFLFEILKTIKEENVNIFNSSINSTVPWELFARPNEVEGFKKSYTSTYIAVPPEKQEKGKIDPIQYLQHFLAFLIANWKLIPTTCCRMTVENILSVVYMPEAIQAHVPCPAFGFQDPPPESANKCIFTFFDDLLKTNADMGYFALAPILSDFIQNIFTSQSTMTDNEMIKIGLNFSRFMILNKKVSDKVLANFNKTFFGFLEVPAFAYKNSTDPTTIECANIFMESFINIIMNNFNIEKGYESLNALVTKYKDTELGIGLFLGIISYIISTKDTSDSARDFVLRIIKSSRKYAAASMKYSRYVATLVLPYILNIKYEDSIEASKKHVMKASRTKQISSCDWFASNCENIFHSPERTNPPIETTLFNDVEKEIEKMQIPVIRLANKENPIEKTKIYLSIIENFDKETDQLYRKNLFAPYIAFHSTIAKIRNLPLGLTEPNDLFFFGAEKLLIKESFTEKDAFDLIQRTMSTIYSRTISSKEMQIAWHNSIKANLNSYSGVAAGVTAIITGQYNALSLVDDIINAIGNHSDIREPYIDFIRLYPLFTQKQKEEVIAVFDKWVTKCNPDIIGPACLYFMTIDKKLKTKMMDNLLVCCRRKSKESLYTLLSASDFVEEKDIDMIISMAETQQKPDNLQLTSLLFYATAAAIVNTCSKHAPRLIKTMQDFVKSLKDPPKEFVNSISTLISYVLVYSQPMRDEYRFSNLSQNKVEQNSRIFTTDETNLLHVKTDDAGVHFETETLSGHYHYNYKRLQTNTLSQKKPIFGFNKVVKSNLTSKNQADFTMGIFKAFNLKECGESNTKQPVSEIKYKYTLPKTESRIENTNAAVLESLGFYQPDSDKLKGVTSENLSLYLPKIQVREGRIQIKCALIYTSDKCSSQADILGVLLQDTSPQFVEFISNIGTAVDLETHTKYDGLLEHAQNTRSIYYSDKFTEIMFHTGPLMKTRDNDPQQVYKKRHIGNDYITVVWCEAGSYDPQTITSQFNFVHIVIYTLSSGYYFVETHRKEKCSYFGPLTHIAVVDKKSLCDLVRKTVIEAQLNINSQQIEYSFPSTQRGLAISSLMKDRDADINTNDLVFF